MKKILTTLIFAMVFSLVPGSAAPAMDQPLTSQPALEVGDLDFGLTAEDSLRLKSGSQLFYSSDSGSTWLDISPETALNDPFLLSSFVGSEMGFVLLLTQTETEVTLELHKTANKGGTWSEINIDLEEKLNQEFTQPFSHFQLQWLNETEGVLLVRETTSSNFSVGKLFKTEDGGQHWLTSEVPVAENFFFLDSQLGFMVNPADSQTLYRSIDGGKSWSIFSLEIPGELRGNAVSIDLPILTEDEQVFFPITISAEDNADYQVLVSLDPKLSAKSPLNLDELVVIPLVIPASIKQTPTGTEKRISEVYAPSPKNLWVGVSGGGCENSLTEDGRVVLDCETTWQMLRSANGGLSWEGVVLPNGLEQLDENYSAQDKPLVSGKTIVTEGQEIQAGEWVQNFQGHVFDKCEVPTLSQLQSWYNSSPYRAVNLYIGGISRFCANAPLTASYIQSIYRQGWKLIPTWVGHQAPCTKYKYPFPYNVDEAYQYGVNNANSANARMKELNLSNADGSGSIIYLDLEHFGYTASCSAAARAYVNGWTMRLAELGIRSGLYSTSSGITANEFFDLDTQFDAAWIAEWYSTPGFRENETVWNLRYLSNDYWINNQRILQYSGGHPETWGGVSMEIDSNVAEGKVAVPFGADLVPPVTTANLSGTIGYNGWYKTPVQVTLAATDNTVGVRYTYYKIDDGDWNLYTGPFTVSGEKIRILRYMSVDMVENWEAPKEFQIMVDTVAPTLGDLTRVGCKTYNAIPQPWCNNAYFVWDWAYDAGVGLPSTMAYQYYWGTNPQGTSTNPTHGQWFDPEAIPSKTPYFLRLRVQDNHGNWSAWKTMFTLIYDPTAKPPIWLPILFKK